MYDAGMLEPALVLTGPFSEGPYAHFNRHLAQTLRSSFDLGLLADDPLSPQLKSLQSLFQYLPTPIWAQIEHRLAPVLDAPREGYWIVMQSWEYGALPRDWEELLCHQADQVWVHTPNQYRDFIRQGVPEARLRLILGGVDPQIFTPDGERLVLPEARDFCFLFRGDMHGYSGLDLLLEAFSAEFLPDEAVSLIIQTDLPDSPDNTLFQALQRAQHNPQVAPIIWHADVMSEKQQASLYRACHALVMPCRGEGFGYTLYEAAACGLPLIVSDLEGRFALPVGLPVQWLAGRLTQHHQSQLAEIPTLSPPWWYECHVADLRLALREAYESGVERISAALQSADEIAQTFSWAAVGRQALSALQELSGPPQRIHWEYLNEKRLAGLAAFDAGQPDKALVILESILSQQSPNARLLFELASLALQQHHDLQALAYLAQALPLAPYHANVYHAAGIALFHLQAYRLAAQAFRHVLRLDPAHPGARESLPEAERCHPHDCSDSFGDWAHLLSQSPQSEPRLALCMIVRNEAAFLRQCLESVPMVHEIVIVDTGSEDGTQEIAREYGAKLIEAPWTGDFSAARNLALRAAESEWILVLDADEVLSPESQYALPALLRQSHPHMAYQLKIRNLSQEDNPVDVVEHYMLRLFPNLPQLAFTGRIHEQLISTDAQFELERIATPDVVIVHYGYTQTLMKTRDKYQRNLKLLQQILAENPEDAFHWFNLGLTHRVNQEDEQALEAFEKAVELTASQADLPTYMIACYSYILAILLHQERYEEARQRAIHMPEICQSTPDYWVNLGGIQNALGDYSAAITAFRRAMQMRNQHFTAVVSDHASTTWKPYAGMGNSYLLQQDFTRADHWFRRALKENPHNPEIVLGLGRLAFVRGDWEQAHHYFKSLLTHPQAQDWQSEARFEMARCEIQQQDLQQAEENLRALLQDELKASLRIAVCSELSALLLSQQRADEAAVLLQDLPHTDQTIQALARFYFQQGTLQQLERLYSQLIEQKPESVTYRLRGTVWVYLKALDKAQMDFETAIMLNPNDAESIHNLGVIALQREQFEVAQQYFERALGIQPQLFESLLDLGQLALHQGQFDAAERHLKAAFQQRPKQIEVLWALAQVAQAQSHNLQAADWYAQLLEQDPQHLESLIQLAYLLTEAGEAPRALQLFDRAFSLGPPQLVLYNGIGLAFIQLGRYLDARNAFLLALQFDPQHPELQRALQLVNQLC